MAQLILTDAEKAAALWSDLDDAALGALLRKKLSTLTTAAAQMDRTVTMAAGLLLCASAAECGAREMTIGLEGVSQEGRSFGDWEVTVRQKLAAPPQPRLSGTGLAAEFFAEAEKLDPQGFARAREERAEAELQRKYAQRYRKLRAGKYSHRVASDILNDTPEGIDAAVDALPDPAQI